MIADGFIYKISVRILESNAKVKINFSQNPFSKRLFNHGLNLECIVGL